MKVVFVLALSFLATIPAYAQERGDDFCVQQDMFYRDKAKDLESSIDQLTLDYEVRYRGVMDNLDTIVQKVEKLEQEKIKGNEDIKNYCSPDAQKQLRTIAENYEKAGEIAGTFRRKSNVALDSAERVAGLLGEDVLIGVVKGDNTISKHDLPKLNLVTPKEIPIVYLQQGILTTVIFPSTIDLVRGYYRNDQEAKGNIIFLEPHFLLKEEKVANIIVKLVNGDVYPIKLKLADKKNPVDILLEIKAEGAD